jgi:hypothetical protein
MSISGIKDTTVKIKDLLVTDISGVSVNSIFQINQNGENAQIGVYQSRNEKPNAIDQYGSLSFKNPVIFPDGSFSQYKILVENQNSNTITASTTFGSPVNLSLNVILPQGAQGAYLLDIRNVNITITNSVPTNTCNYLGQVYTNNYDVLLGQQSYNVEQELVEAFPIVLLFPIATPDPYTLELQIQITDLYGTATNWSITNPLITSLVKVY